MKPISLSFCLYSFWLYALSIAPTPTLGFAQESPSTPVFLGVHEQRILSLPGIQKYSLGSNSVRALKLPNDRLLIKGAEAGQCDLIWFGPKNESHLRAIRVEKWDPKPHQQELVRALSVLQETEVFVSGKGALLRGEIQSFRELQQITALAMGFPESITNQTLPSEQLVSEAQTKIQSLLDKNLWDISIKIIRDGRALIARGSIDDPKMRLRIEKELKAAFPTIELELESLPDSSPTVSFKVFLMELKKTKMRSLGVGWPGETPGAFRVTPFQIQQNLALELSLQALEGEGSAHLLSRPELVVRAPGEAELFAGGELPIKTVSRFGENVSWKNFGLTLKLKVTHSTEHQARLEIFTEVSHLDQQIALHQIPGIQASRMKTQVDARFGVPLFLSGLLQ